MKLTSSSLSNGQPIPEAYAFGKPHPTNNVDLSSNISPHLTWSDLPEGTKSVAIVCHDPDVPSVGDNVNKEGKTVPLDLPRVDFFHWVLIDVPPSRSELQEGEFSDSIVGGGKNGPDAKDGMRQGLNSYTQWFDGDADMHGNYFGYDGPCPPWNDERIHHYYFTAYALDVAKLKVAGNFSGPDVIDAMSGHILGQSTIIGTYHIYPDAKLS